MSFITIKNTLLYFFCALFLLISPGAVPCRAGIFTLASDGRARSVVIVEEEATAIEKHAAEELALFLSAVTGADIRKANGPVDGKYSIWLGTPETSPGIRKAGILDEVEGLSEQGFLLHASDEGLVIAGSAPLGAMFGAYGFLEEHVGMRWYFPGEHGEYRPDIPDLSIGRLNETQEPSFKRRLVGFSRVGGHQHTPDTWDWIARNRMQSRLHERQRQEYEKRGADVTGGGHVLHRMVPDELFDEHPEYFGKYDGERRKQRGHRGQPCTTHPDVIDLAVEYMLDWFEENPGGRFTLNNNDYSRFCECEDCVALDPEEERRGRIVSTRFFTFKNEVARRVWQEKPEARINTLAYQTFRMPPTGIEPDPRLRVKLCDHGRCFRHSLDDPGCGPNAWFRDMFEGWAEFEGIRAYYPYYNMIGGQPREGIISTPMERIIARDMRYMKELGHRDWRITVRPPDADYGERFGTPATLNEWRGNFRWYYMQAKLAWNIDIDEEKLLAELDEKFYGPAAGPMSRYHEFIRELWEKTPGHFEYGAEFKTLGKSMIAPNSIRKPEMLLDEALEAAEGRGVYEERVEKDRHIWENSWKLLKELYKRVPGGAAFAMRAVAPLEIDGLPFESPWRQARRFTGFTGKNAEAGEVREQTYARFLFDDEHLYISLEMEEPDPESLISRAGERDSPLIDGDDTVEIFLDPEGKNRRYVHFTVNPDGVFRDAEWKAGTGADADFDSGARVAARRGEGIWTVEMKVPAESVGGEIIPGATWQINLGRIRRAGGEETRAIWEPEGMRRVVIGRSVLNNGDFAETEELKESHAERGAVGEKVPAGWNVRGGEYQLIEGPSNVLRIRESGLLFQYLRYPRRIVDGNRILAGEVVASGNGSIRIRTSTCVRPPGVAMPFSHDKRTDLIEVEMQREPGAYHFKYELEPYEQGYLYIHVRGDVQIENISTVID